MVVFVASVLSRKRWVSHQSGAFRGALRIVGSEVDDLSATWHRGYRRSGPVCDLLMWTRAPFLFRNELVAVEGLDEQRPARIGEVKRLGALPTPDDILRVAHRRWSEWRDKS